MQRVIISDAILTSLSAARKASVDAKTLKTEIRLRSQYEKLQAAVKKTVSSYSGKKAHAAAVAKFVAFKKANPKCPKVKLSVLQTRLRNAIESKSPEKKKARIEGAKAKALVLKQIARLESQRDDEKSELDDLSNKDYDYTPDDVDDPKKYKDSIRAKIKALTAQIKKLKGTSAKKPGAKPKTKTKTRPKRV